MRIKVTHIYYLGLLVFFGLTAVVFAGEGAVNDGDDGKRKRPTSTAPT